MNYRIVAFLYGILSILVITNILYLDYKLITSAAQITDVSETANAPVPTDTICASNCIEEFNRKIASFEAALAALPTQTQTAQTTLQAANAKEFFIPLGSGNSTSTSWVNVAGISAYIDPRNYTNIKAIYFEATIDVPTNNQTVSVRMFQNNEGYPVWNSEMQYTGNSSQLLISQPLTLEAGNKLYTVQMKTQLGYTANISQARVRIVTK